MHDDLVWHSFRDERGLWAADAGSRAACAGQTQHVDGVEASVVPCGNPMQTSLNIEGRLRDEESVGRGWIEGSVEGQTPSIYVRISAFDIGFFHMAWFWRAPFVQLLAVPRRAG